MEIKTLVVGPLLTNCYLLISNGEAIVIDPGAGFKRILQELKGKKLLYIILTHYHWDHVLAAQALKEKTGAKILIHKGEKDFIKFQPDQFLDGGEEIKIGKEYLKIIHTPGHSKGSIAVVGENFIFVGDTLFKDGFGTTALPGGSEKELKETLKMMKKLIKPETKIYPGHGESFFLKDSILK